MLEKGLQILGKIVHIEDDLIETVAMSEKVYGNLNTRFNDNHPLRTFPDHVGETLSDGFQAEDVVEMAQDAYQDFTPDFVENVISNIFDALF